MGFLVPRLLPFTENLIAEAIGLAVGLGLAIILIEGRFLTQQARRRTIIARTAKSIVGEADEIGMMLTWEFGNFLASALDWDVGLRSEDRGDDWVLDIKPLLQQIYGKAECVDVGDIPYQDTLPYEEYRGWVDSTKHYSQRIRNRIEANLDVHERLLELGEAFDDLDHVLVQSMWSTSAGIEAKRFNSLGRIGNSLIHVMETIGTVHKGL
ncbi:MAG: hypothetical protein OXL97_09300 [Chloroflexota bacterium]|nr:hypothetical protein [Chloroflexota bacterium]